VFHHLANESRRHMDLQGAQPVYKSRQDVDARAVSTTERLSAPQLLVRVAVPRRHRAAAKANRCGCAACWRDLKGMSTETGHGKPVSKTCAPMFLSARLTGGGTAVLLPKRSRLRMLSRTSCCQGKHNHRTAKHNQNKASATHNARNSADNKSAATSARTEGKIHTYT
jgi:hypothetical protein